MGSGPTLVAFGRVAVDGKEDAKEGEPARLAAPRED